MLNSIKVALAVMAFAFAMSSYNGGEAVSQHSFFKTAMLNNTPLAGGSL